jgi:hypothetical protein
MLGKSGNYEILGVKSFPKYPELKQKAELNSLFAQ